MDHQFDRSHASALGVGRHYCFAKSRFYVKKDEPKGSFWGYASVFNVPDHHGDIVRPGSFRHSLMFWKHLGKWPGMFLQHDATAPLGFWTNMEENDQGLVVHGQLLFQLPKAKEAYEWMGEGVMDSLSIGFSIIDSIEDPSCSYRLLKQLHLCEVSLVAFGANEWAKVKGVKQASTSSSSLASKHCLLGAVS